MKRGFLSVIVMLTTLSTQAQTTFFDGTWKEAFIEAQKQNKYLFIDCYTDWCSWCKVADKKTFPDKAVGAVLNEHFVSVKVDMERGEGVTLAQKYRVTGFPTYLMFSPNGLLVKKMAGYYENHDAFIEEVKKAMDESQQPNYPSKLTDKVVFPAFYTHAFTNKDTEKKRTNPDVKEVNDWLRKQPDLLSEQAWSVMYRFPLDQVNEAAFLDKLKQYVTIYGVQEAMEVVQKLAGQKLQVALKSKQQADLNRALQFVDQHILEGKEDTKAFFELRFFAENQDWSRYAKAAQTIIDKKGLANHTNGVNNYSWTIYENVTDPEILEIALGWMAQVVALDPQYMYLDTYAALFYKAGKYDEALTWANKAIETGKSNNQNVQDTQELRDEIILAKDQK